ncbi:hypothetical protein, partial [Pseudomonas syringae]|uniref:hypothetical protein n=1 Tax=Pseudomonas syringae TaxID=317 RepID=UPI001E44EFE7
AGRAPLRQGWRVGAYPHHGTGAKEPDEVGPDVSAKPDFAAPQLPLTPRSSSLNASRASSLPQVCGRSLQAVAV